MAHRERCIQHLFLEGLNHTSFCKCAIYVLGVDDYSTERGLKIRQCHSHCRYSILYLSLWRWPKISPRKISMEWGIHRAPFRSFLPFPLSLVAPLFFRRSAGRRTWRGQVGCWGLHCWGEPQAEEKHTKQTHVSSQSVRMGVRIWSTCCAWHMLVLCGPNLQPSWQKTTRKGGVEIMCCNQPDNQVQFLCRNLCIYMFLTYTKFSIHLCRIIVRTCMWRIPGV